MMPRLPVNNPRCGVATMSPDGVTRFCSGMEKPDYSSQASLRAQRRLIHSFACRSMDCFAALAMTERSRRAVADRRLERERGIPGKVDPCVLRHLGDKRVDQRPALRLGVDRRKMRIRHHRAHQPAGLAGVDEIVDDQKSLAGAAAEFCHFGRNALESLQLALPGMVVAGNADGIDDANA